MTPSENSTTTDVASASAPHDRLLPEEEVLVEVVPEHAAWPRFWERKGYHLLLLLGSVVVLALAGCLRVRGEREVMVPILNQPLPTFCVARRTIGMDCPGCGMTRSFISLAHGDLASAWRYNPAAFFLFPLLVLQIPYRALQVHRIGRGLPEWNWTHSVLLVWLFVPMLFGQWAVKVGRAMMGEW